MTSPLSRRLRHPTRVLAVSLVLAAPAATQIVFQAPIGSTPCEFAQSVVLGDVDEDGHLDAITSTGSAGTQPALSMGLGDGHFAAPQPLTTFFFGGGVSRLADFDEDGHLDALSANGDIGSSSFAVQFGDGQGGFGLPLAVNLADELPGDADVGDFDADGHADIAILNRPTFQQSASLLVLLGLGDGSFAAPITLATLTKTEVPGFTGTLQAGDTDGDGLDDLVLVGVNFANGVLRSVGGGRFEPVACGGGCVLPGTGSALADFNGDGRLDLLSPTTVLLAQPDGSLQLGGSLPLGGIQISAAPGDFDADGALDVALGNSGGLNGFFPSTIAFVRGHGDGSFDSTKVVVSSVGGSAGHLATGDLDGDGRQDLAVAGFSSTPGGSRLSALLNHTYPAGSPFTDLGFQSQGLGGYPIQLASGTLVAGQPFSFKLVNVIGGQPAYHVVGFTQLNAPFKGGTMVPNPFLVNGPFAASPSGVLNLAGNWPAGGSGVTLYAQFWVPNFLGFPTFSASSGVRAQIP